MDKGYSMTSANCISVLISSFTTVDKSEFFFSAILSTKEKIERVICDFIAGMTDRYALTLYKKLFVPREW
ncbi:Deoxyguanosinetriphosphate triphosphohydrolase-like protein [subsurface metagenome]